MITTLLKTVVLSAVNALGIWACVGLYQLKGWGLLFVLIFGLGGLNAVLLSRKAYPLRYLLPGLVLFGLMVVYPIVYNINISFMNYGTGNILSKSQVIFQFTNEYFQPENGEHFSYLIFKNVEGNMRVLLVSKKTNKAYLSVGDHLKLADVHDPLFVYQDGEIVEIDGYQRMSKIHIIQNLNEIQNLAFKYNDGIVKFYSTDEFRVFKPLYRYDKQNDVLINLKTGKVYRPVNGTFVSSDGEKLSPGFRAFVGFKNFIDILRNPQISGPFLRVFTWTFLWALLSVFTTFVLGLTLAILLNDSTLKLRYLYRTLLIVPYVIPGYVSVLIWRGLFNTNFGVINDVLQKFLSTRISWFQDPFWAKVALLIVNLWLGFPYMMLISLGALQSIPPELYEAARVDGASSWRRFRSITLPLLMISLAPLLIGSFAFNFNNFTVIYLLTGGGPPIPGSQTPAGATDILISYTYKLAFGGAGAQYGYAAAISVIIFLIIGSISVANFRFTKRLEEMSESL